MSFEALRQCQAVLLPALCGATLEQTAAVLGVSRATVSRLQAAFRKNPAPQPNPARNWGGQRESLLTPAEEVAFLTPWLASAATGQLVVAAPFGRRWPNDWADRPALGGLSLIGTPPLAQSGSRHASSQEQTRGAGGVEKKLPEELAALLTPEAVQGRHVRLMFQDEARFGRMVRLRRCWAPAPQRPVVDNGYEREVQYVYGAVSPLEGELDWRIAPVMNTEQMGTFLAQVSAAHPEDFIVMVVDGASSHVAKALVVPENIRLPACPRIHHNSIRRNTCGMNCARRSSNRVFTRHGWGRANSGDRPATLGCRSRPGAEHLCLALDSSSQPERALELLARHHWRKVAPTRVIQKQTRGAGRVEKKTTPEALATLLTPEAHFDIQAQPQPSDPVGVVGVTGPARLVRVVALAGSLLVAVDGLDGGVDVQHPRLVEQRFPQRAQVALLPGARGELVELFQAAPGAVLAQDFAHAQQRRADRIEAQGGDVCVAAVTAEDREQQGAQHVTHGRRVVAAEAERRVGAQPGEEFAGFEKLGEEDQLPQRGGRGRIVPLHVVAPALGVHDQGLFGGCGRRDPSFERGDGLLTRRVSHRKRSRRCHPSIKQQLAALRQEPTAGFRVKSGAAV